MSDLLLKRIKIWFFQKVGKVVADVVVERLCLSVRRKFRNMSDTAMQFRFVRFYSDTNHLESDLIS